MSDEINNDNTPANIEEWKKSAEQGDAEAQYELGMAYYFGQGVEQDDKQAIEWYTKSAEQGNTSAQHELESIKKEGK